MIVVGRRIDHRIPGVLVAVAGATLAVSLFDLTGDGISVVGVVPAGFPRPQFPSVAMDDVGPLLVAAVGIAFVTLADTTALSRTFARKVGDDVDPNQEVVGLGAANLAAGFSAAFPSAPARPAPRWPIRPGPGANSRG